MPKTIVSFNATEEVYELLKNKTKGKVSEFVNGCILESQKPKLKPVVEIQV